MEALEVKGEVGGGWAVGWRNEVVDDVFVCLFRSVCEDCANARREAVKEEEDEHQEVHTQSLLQ